jgi:hypothetical protein
MKNSETDYGYGEPRTVQHAVDSIDRPGYLSSSIYENLQHTDLYYFSRGWYDTTNWYLKPVMRIKQAITRVMIQQELYLFKVLNYWEKK